MNRDVITTSFAEQQLAYECEWDKAVTFFLEQPFGIQYWLDGRRATYPPDLFRVRSGRPEVIEAKDLKGASDPDWTAREAAIRDAIDQLGFHFDVWVVEEMAPQPRRDNLWRQIQDRISPVPRCAGEVIRHLRSTGPLPLWAVMHDLGVRFEPLRQLVAHGLVYADINQVFDEDLILSCDSGALEVEGRS